MTMLHWHPSSWRKMNCSQAVPYSSIADVDEVVYRLSLKPPLVSVEQVLNLNQLLAKASQGEGFILQAGACAERFEDCTAEKINNEITLLKNLAEQLEGHLKKSIICINRLAGQYAKPRSSITETKGETTLLCYRGDSINQPEFTEEARKPNPQRLLQAYEYSQRTLKFLGNHFTSHEALLLYYEEALTHKLGNWFNLSTHFPWLGMRTGQLEGAHVEYLRGIANPIGIKIGPHTSAQWLVELLSILNPHRIPGRITLITRLGVNHVQHALPPLIKATKQHQQPVLWMCDPMHGNTRITDLEIKTRYFEDIENDLKFTQSIHHQLDSYLGGLHLEISSDPITECIGGKASNSVSDLTRDYRSLVDPRLNPQQAHELVQSFILNSPQSLDLNFYDTLVTTDDSRFITN